MHKILLFTVVGAFIGGVRGWIAHRDKLERERRAAPPPPALPPSVLAFSLTTGPAWGWVWFHSAASGARGLGYFFVDSSHGPSLRVFADLRANPDEPALRAEIAARLPSAGVPMHLGSHKLVTADDPDASRASEARALFDAGRDGACEVILLRVSPSERDLLAIPEKPAFVDQLF
jgi:hypothetical protein